MCLDSNQQPRNSYWLKKHWLQLQKAHLCVNMCFYFWAVMPSDKTPFKTIYIYIYGICRIRHARRGQNNNMAAILYLDRVLHSSDPKRRETLRGRWKVEQSLYSWRGNLLVSERDKQSLEAVEYAGLTEVCRFSWQVAEDWGSEAAPTKLHRSWRRRLLVGKEWAELPKAAQKY